MQRTPSTIDDGFDKPFKPVIGKPSTDDGPSNGTGKPPIGIEEPEILTGEPITSFDTVDPVAVTDDRTTDSGDTGRRRGRPKGSKNKIGLQPPPNLIADFEALLLSVHFMGAKLLSTPELELEPEEAKKLADAIKEVARHYSLAMEPKKLALYQLAFTAGGIYGPRFIAIVKSKPRPVAPATAPGPQLVKQEPRPEPRPEPVPANSGTGSLHGLTPSQLWPEIPFDNFSTNG